MLPDSRLTGNQADTPNEDYSWTDHFEMIKELIFHFYSLKKRKDHFKEMLHFCL